MENFPTERELKKMQETDLSTVDKGTLVDINHVHINPDLPYAERIREFVCQIKNPYCYLNNGIVVKVSFSGKETLEDCVARYIRSKA
ncbi:MAG: hypothetical protein LUG91_05160 [Ruminococcus sp.]|nr:hypothetical protein [Ruminococcus sp.]